MKRFLKQGKVESSVDLKVNIGAGTATNTSNTVVIFVAANDVRKGSDITILHATASGDTLIINQDGLYYMECTGGLNGNAMYGVTVNASVVSNIESLAGGASTASQVACITMFDDTGSNRPITVSSIKRLRQGDLVRMQTTLANITFSPSAATSFCLRRLA